jgi:hypothetical protein
MVSPHFAVADDKTSDKANSNSSGDAAPAKTNAPAPLTDRERWLLDRVEQLARRVADLESVKHGEDAAPAKVANSPAAAPSSDLAAVAHVRMVTRTSSTIASTKDVSTSPTAVESANAISKDRVAAEIAAGSPGDPFKAWDASATFDYMPSQYITFRWEFDHRAANVPYFSGPGGVTPTSCPSAPLVENICGTPGSLVPGFTPDLKKIENRIDLAILVKF